MAIQITTPIIVPPQPEKVADRIWILNLNVNAQNGASSPVSTYFHIAPFISSTGEILHEKAIHLHLGDTLSECEGNPTLANALHAIYAAVDFLCKQRGFFGMELEPIAIEIVSHPENLEINMGGTAEFSVNSTGSPQFFQWKKDGNILLNTDRISGTNSSTLTINTVQSEDEGEYTVTVFNSLGEITSGPATLVLNDIEE